MDTPLALRTPVASGPSIRSGWRRTRLSDERLAKLVARDGETAFAEIYRRYHQSLYGYCRSIVRDETDAEDALQSAMAGAYAALRKGDRDVSLRPWLFRIAHNESVSVLRRRRPQEIPADEQVLAARAPTGEPQQALEQRERLATLISDLETLSVRQRGALLMRELSGLSIEELAAALGTSASAAKQALFEARTALREQQEGRAMECEQITKLLWQDDRRLLRGRRVRSHMRSCAACREAQEALSTRSADLRLLAPPLPALVASAMLARLLGHATAGPLGAAAGAASGAASAGGATAGGAGPATVAGTAGGAAAGGAGPAAGAVAAGSASAAGGAAGAGATSGVAGLAAHLGGAAALKVAAGAAIVAAAAVGAANVVVSGHVRRPPVGADHRAGAAATQRSGLPRPSSTQSPAASAVGAPASAAAHSRAASALGLRGSSGAHSGGSPAAQRGASRGSYSLGSAAAGSHSSSATGSPGSAAPGSPGSAALGSPGSAAVPSNSVEASPASPPAAVRHAPGESRRMFAPGQSRGTGAASPSAGARHEAAPGGLTRGHSRAAGAPGLAEGHSQTGSPPGVAHGRSRAGSSANVPAKGRTSPAPTSSPTNRTAPGAASTAGGAVRNSTPTGGAKGHSGEESRGASHSHAVATRPASGERGPRGSSSAARDRSAERAGHGDASRAQTAPGSPQTSVANEHGAEKSSSAGVGAGHDYEEHAAPGQTRKQSEAQVTGATGPQPATTTPETNPAEPGKGQGKGH